MPQISCWRPQHSQRDVTCRTRYVRGGWKRAMPVMSSVLRLTARIQPGLCNLVVSEREGRDCLVMPRRRYACMDGLSRIQFWTGGQAGGHPGNQHELHLHHAQRGRHAAARASSARPGASSSPPLFASDAAQARPGHAGCRLLLGMSCGAVVAVQPAELLTVLVARCLQLRAPRKRPFSRRLCNVCDATVSQCTTRQSCGHASN